MYQQITIAGNVGRDPELRYTPQGVAVCDFSAAVNRRVGGGEGQEARDETTWFKVTCWRQLAETVAKYVKKGKQVLVVGEVSVDAYTDKAGQPAATLVITAQTVKFLGQRDDSEGGESAPPARSGNQQRQQSGGQQRSQGNQRGGGSADDIPF